MVMSDFCFDPYNTVLSLLGTSGGTPSEAAVYYTNCTGTSPFSASFTSAQTAIGYLNGNITTATAPGGICPNETNLILSQSVLTDMSSQLGAFNTALNCSSLSYQYHNFIDNGICDSLFSALFVTAVTFLCTSAFLFALVCVISVTYQFFGSLWKLKPQHGNQVGNDEELQRYSDIEDYDEKRGTEKPLMAKPLY